jgi:hypothetical protein
VAKKNRTGAEVQVKGDDREIQEALQLLPEAAVFAIYGLVHLVLLLTAAEVEQVKLLLHALGVR